MEKRTHQTLSVCTHNHQKNRIYLKSEPDHYAFFGANMNNNIREYKIAKINITTEVHKFFCIVPQKSLSNIFNRHMKQTESLHPFSNAYPVKGRGVSGAYLHIFGWRQGTAWTSRQLIAGPTYRDKQRFSLTFTPTQFKVTNLPNPQFCMFLECGRKQEYFTFYFFLFAIVNI